ncbi:MAG: hypothetical protein OXC80_06335, partial [Gammaproteobacteria bacterium]|nr:hypothetical protein [Gammaproteobacteria bacterium]
NGRLRVNGRKLLSLEEARDKWGKQLNVRFNGDSCDKFSAVADLLQQHKGKKGFSFVIETDEQQYELKAGADWKVSMSDGLLSELAQILSPHAVWVDYKSSS